MIEFEPKNRSVVGRVHAPTKVRSTKSSGMKADVSNTGRVKEFFVTSFVLSSSGTTVVLRSTASLIIAILLSVTRGKEA